MKQRGKCTGTSKNRNASHFSSSSDAPGTQCINELKQKLLKLAMEKHPSILSSVDGQEVKVSSRMLDTIFNGDDE